MLQQQEESLYVRQPICLRPRAHREFRCGGEKVLFEDYDVCAYHIIVGELRSETMRRSFQHRRHYRPSSLFSLPSTTITSIKRYEWDKKMGTIAFSQTLTTLHARVSPED